MAAIKVGEKWYVKKKDGTTGKRGYKTQANALKAQSTGRKNLGKGGKKPKKRTVKKVKKSGSSGGHSTKTFYIAPNIGAAAVPAMLAIAALSGQMSWQAMLGKLCAAYTGFDPYIGTWDSAIAFANYGAIGLGTVASKFASKTGLNKRLAKGVNI